MFGCQWGVVGWVPSLLEIRCIQLLLPCQWHRSVDRARADACNGAMVLKAGQASRLPRCQGGKWTSARRASFLIGLDGKIAHVTDVPSADVHLAEMKEAVAKLAGN